MKRNPNKKSETEKAIAEVYEILGINPITGKEKTETEKAIEEITVRFFGVEIEIE